MANWIAVWRTSDGKLESVGSVIASPLPVGLSQTDLGVDESLPSPQNGKIWNQSTHAFDVSTLKSVLTLKQFWDRWTQAERESLMNIQLTGTAVQKQKLGAFKDYVRDAGVVDCNDAYIQASLTAAVNAAILTAPRAAVIGA